MKQIEYESESESDENSVSVDFHEDNDDLEVFKEKDIAKSKKKR